MDGMAMGFLNNRTGKGPAADWFRMDNSNKARRGPKDREGRA
jgi:hypothetical protein